MAILEVIKMGHPKLRQISEPVDPASILTPEFQETIDHLIATMKAMNGAGLAAPQVGIMKRIFIMGMDHNPRYPDKESIPLHVAINPEISLVADEKVESWEGCLSIPGIRGRLMRHHHVRLTAIDRYGQTYNREVYDFAAVVAQHELDHLDGILFIDRMQSMETLTFHQEYQDYWLEI